MFVDRYVHPYRPHWNPNPFFTTCQSVAGASGTVTAGKQGIGGTTTVQMSAAAPMQAFNELGRVDAQLVAAS